MSTTTTMLVAKQKPSKAGMSADKLLSITATMKNDAVVAQIDTTGLERLPVVQVRRKLDAELIAFHDEQMAFIHSSRNKANAQAIAIFEKISYKMRWAVPALPAAQRSNTIDFCKHLLGETPTEVYQDIAIFEAWSKNSVGKPTGRITHELQELVYELKSTVLSRNDIIEDRRKELINQTNKMTLKRESRLRWAIENTHGQRNTYWTIWYLSGECLMPELRRFCENEANKSKFLKARDMELGWTALHYAVRNNHMESMKYLISLDDAPFNDPNRIELLKTPDGRTPLHIAAAYASREIVLELLALGCGTQIKDNVGCYPVDLAIQNKNQETFIVLSRWNKLVPDDPNAKLDVKKVEETPEEYLDTPDHVIDKMSTDLRIVSRRIEKIKPNKVSFMTNCTCTDPVNYSESWQGEEVKEVDQDLLCEGCKDSLKYINDLFLEMRLCDKACKMAFKEGFIFDGLKALRRKWMVAKKIFLKQLGLGFKELNLSEVDEVTAFCDCNRFVFGEHLYNPNATELRGKKEEMLSSTFGSALDADERMELRGHGFDINRSDSKGFISDNKNEKEDIDTTLDMNELQMNSAIFCSTIASEDSIMMNSTINFDVESSLDKSMATDFFASKSDGGGDNMSNTVTAEFKAVSTTEVLGGDASSQSFNGGNIHIGAKDPLQVRAEVENRENRGRFDLESVARANSQQIPSISNISNPSKLVTSSSKLANSKSFKLVQFNRGSVLETAPATYSFESVSVDDSRSNNYNSNKNNNNNNNNNSNSNSNSNVNYSNINSSIEHIDANNSNQTFKQNINLNESTNIASQWRMYSTEFAVRNSSILKRYGMQGMAGESLVEIGLELAEKLLQDCQEGIAGVVLEECSNVPINSVNSKVAIFARRSEVLLLTYDYITYFITQKSRKEHLDESEKVTPEDVMTMDHGVFDKASGTRSFQNVYNRLARLSTIGKPREYYDNYDAAQYINIKNILTDSSSFDYDGVGKNRDITLIRRKLLDKGLNVVKEAIIMHEKEYNHDLIEPSTLAPLLEISAMYFERQGNNVAAYHALTRAVVVFQRALGNFHKEAVRVMLDTLRLQIKCSDIEGLQLCTVKATEISRELDKLSKVDEKAADLLSRKCAEMLGLCKLIEQELKKKSKNPKIAKKQNKLDSQPHHSIIRGLKTQEISQDELNGEHRGIAYLNDYTNYSESVGHNGLVVKISQSDNIFFNNDGVFSSLSILQYSPLTKLVNK